MKFRRKPVISSVIDAERYKPGMEDGFETRYNDVKRPHYTWEIKCSSKDIPVQVPYLNLMHGKKFIRACLKIELDLTIRIGLIHLNQKIVALNR